MLKLEKRNVGADASVCPYEQQKKETKQMNHKTLEAVHTHTHTPIF